MALPLEEETFSPLQFNLDPPWHPVLLWSFFPHWGNNRIVALRGPSRCRQSPWPLVVQCLSTLLALSQAPGPPPCGKYRLCWFSPLGFIAPSRQSHLPQDWVGSSFCLLFPHTAAVPACGLGRSLPLQLSAHPGHSAWVHGLSSLNLDLSCTAPNPPHGRPVLRTDSSRSLFPPSRSIQSISTDLYTYHRLAPPVPSPPL